MSIEPEELSQLQRAYAEYGELSGYLEREYSIEWQDEAGNTWRKTCTVINLGRPDRGVPVDPDEAMESEDGLFSDENSQMADAWRARHQRKLENDAILVERLREAFVKYGPMTTTRMANKVNLKRARVKDLVKNHPDIFKFFGGTERTWGLLHQEMPAVVKRKVTPLMIAARELLLERGPMTAPEVANALGKYQTSIHNSLKTRDDWFVGVGIRPMEGNRPAACIWGLVGVHDQQATR